MAASIIAELAGLFLGQLLERRFFAWKSRTMLLVGGGFFLMGLIGGYASRFHLFPLMGSVSMFVLMLGVPFLSEGLWRVTERTRGGRGLS